MGLGAVRRSLIGTCALVSFAACVPTPEPRTALPDVAPQARTPAARVAPPQPPSAESQQLAVYYQRLQNDLVVQGLLRGDGGGPDAPFTDTVLARNFVRIALFDEYTAVGDELRPQARLSRLRRWDQPVRMSVEFGPNVSADQRDADRAAISAYAARLARVTGLSIQQTDAAPNFHVLILNEDERRAAGERLRAIVPGISSGSLNAILNLPRNQLCIVVAFSEGNTASYSKAVAVIRSEHPNLLRTSCFHEELAQGLGLANDSPYARPSIFNDDDEFALLTSHDEKLLGMLYDPRLQIGMLADEARGIVRQLAREATGEALVN